jgi:hypothetical protein
MLAAPTVAPSIASLNVTVTVELIATFVALFAGELEITEGGVLSEGAAVVNVEVNGDGSDTPFDPCTPVVTVIV